MARSEDYPHSRGDGEVRSHDAAARLARRLRFGHTDADDPSSAASESAGALAAANGGRPSGSADMICRAAACATLLAALCCLSAPAAASLSIRVDPPDFDKR